MMEFIKRERIYIIMFLFIAALNIISLSKGVEMPAEKERPISSMTFEEAGITEQHVIGYLSSGKPIALFFQYALIIGAVIFITSIIWNLFFIVGIKRVELFRGPAGKTVSWEVLDLIRTVIGIVFIGYVIGFLEGIVIRYLKLNMSMNLRMIVSTFFVDLSALGVIFYVINKKYRQKLSIIGLEFSRFSKNLLVGIKIYILILPWLLLALILSLWILTMLGYTPPAEPVFEAFIGEKNSRVLLFLTVFVSIFGPIVEEVFFRGFMYSVIRKHLGFLCAGFLSASIFSMLHTNIVGFLPIMLLGMLLAYLYEKTGSLVAPITVHIVHNSIILGFVFFIKELMG